MESTKRSLLSSNILSMAMLLAGMVTVPVASAYFLGYSALDNMEIRYGGSTEYTTAYHSSKSFN